MADDEKGITLIAGLGNEGDEYANSRHNAGFWFVDALAREHDAEFRAIKKIGVTCEVEIASQRIRLFKSNGYMNNSGQGLGEAARYWKVAPENMLVVYDELDFVTGCVRLRFGGGAAGHNGVTSVISHIGKSFWRLRVGIAHPGRKKHGQNYVLGHASSAEREKVEEQFVVVRETLPGIVQGEFEIAMTKLHTECDAGADKKAGKAESNNGV